MAIITLNNNSLSSVTSLPAAIATGKVLQVVQASHAGQVQNTTTTYADTGLSVSITPSSTSSKILINLSQKFMIALGTTDRDSPNQRLLRDSTAIWTDDNFYTQTTGVSSKLAFYVPINYLESPSTTSAITYKTQFSLGSTATNKYILANQGNQPSTITALEIAT